MHRKCTGAVQARATERGLALIDAAELEVLRAVVAPARDPSRVTRLAWALETGQDAGIGGGLAEDERRVLSRADDADPGLADRLGRCAMIKKYVQTLSDFNVPPLVFA